MLRTLTALRFPAALAVFLSHAAWTRMPAIALSAGYAGVGFFFLLSGFILTYNYRGSFSNRNFYVARFARIYPVHLLAMAVAVPVLLIAGGGPEWNNAPWTERWPALVMQALLLQSWFPSAHVHFTGNGPAWSLSDEAFFYALFPFALGWGSRVFARSTRLTLLAAAAALWALLAAAVCGVNAAFDQWALFVLPAVRFVDFAAGMLLAGAFLRRSKWNPAISPTLLEVVTVCALALGVALTAFAPQSMRFSAAMMPFFAALIFVFAMERGAISRALRLPAFVLLGEASYAFYLLHVPVIRTVQMALPHNAPLAFALALLISMAVSVAVFRFVETPLRRAIRARFAAAAPGESAAPATAPALSAL